MSTPDNKNSREVKELLQQLKELHAPDRCEGPGNFIWHGMQRFSNFGSSKRTDQQKIRDHWNAKRESSGVQQKDELKKLASLFVTDFFYVCFKVDETRTKDICNQNEEVWQLTNNITKEENAIRISHLDEIIDGSTSEKVQKMFDIMIVQWDWRTRMLQAWDIH
jgi:hypothetical protein